jgi:hypothetical protein
VTIVYRTVSGEVVLDADVPKGTPRESVTARLYRLKGRDAREEVELPERTPTFEGNRARYEWRCAGALTAAQLREDYQLELHDGRTVIARLHVLVYQPAVKIEAVDKDGNAVEGAVCKLTAHVDDLSRPDCEKPERHRD